MLVLGHNETSPLTCAP